jgi:hypothetical protein
MTDASKRPPRQAVRPRGTSRATRRTRRDEDDVSALVQEVELPELVTNVPPGGVEGDMVTLDAAGLFEAELYLRRNPDVAEAGMDPLEHFCRYGWQEGRDPNAWFDTDWYLTENPDVAENGMNPLVHFALWGDVEARRPSPAFDPNAYRGRHGLHQGVSALAHYLANRLHGASPVPWFDGAWYLRQNPDVAEARVDPFIHYVTYGSAEGRLPRPEADLLSESGLFDAAYYLQSNPDVHENIVEPLLHFREQGWHQDRRPNPYFSPAWYIRTHLAGMPAETNPLTHYVLQGEVRDLLPILWFDPGWYRREYQLTPHESPLAHFLIHRASQTVSPTPLFDVAFYMAEYGHLVGAKEDPFAHYLEAGCSQDLNPSAAFDAAEYRARHMKRPKRGSRGKPPLEQRHPLIHYLTGAVFA